MMFYILSNVIKVMELVYYLRFTINIVHPDHKFFCICLLNHKSSSHHTDTYYEDQHTPIDK